MDDYGQMFKRQLSSWPLAAENYMALGNVMTKEFMIDGMRIKLQCNPSRITSSSAVVSNATIQQRPCFLCAKNRPFEQECLTFDGFTILVNPFPVFPKHFTIAGEHKPQTIKGNFEIMLHFAKYMDDCVVFYNGPKCGASAPDHIHFQAGSKGLMPVETDYTEWLKSNKLILLDSKKIQVYKLHDFLRGGWLIEGRDKNELEQIFYRLLDTIETVLGKTDEEPMLNLLCWYKDGKWIVLVFPRRAHRPTCYFRSDENKLLISPASVEMGGLVVAARPEDFKRIRASDIKQIFSEVSLPETEIEKISDMIRSFHKK